MSERLHRPPVKFTLAPHAANDLPALIDHYGEVAAFLSSSSSKRAIAATECADRLDMSSKRIFEGTKNGYSYGGLVIEESFFSTHLRLPKSDEETSGYSDQFLREVGSYTRMEIDRLDRLAIDHPNQIAVLTEGASAVEINNEARNLIKEYGGHFIKLVKEMKINEIFQLYRTTVSQTAGVLRQRDQGVANSIMEVVDEDVDKIFGLFGTVHTGITHILAANGFVVERNFPEKRGRNLYFEPMDVLIRKLAFFPDNHPTDLEWKESFLANTMFNILAMIPLDEQIAANMANSFQRDLSSGRWGEDSVQKHWDALETGGINDFYLVVLMNMPQLQNLL